MKKLLYYLWLAFMLVPCEGKDKTLRIGNNSDPYALDPHLVSSVAEYKVVSALFEGLVNFHPETLEPIPGVAESWKISEDGMTYTFKLRKEAKWTNGDKITANDFVFSVKRVLSKPLGSPNVDMFFYIKNAKEYFNGAITDFDKVGIKATADDVLTIQITSHVPYFLSILASPAWMPVNEKCVIKHGAIDDRTNKWSRENNIVTNGAFRVKSWNVGDSIKLVQNKNYWNNEIVKCDAVEILTISDASTEERMFLNNEIEITETVSFVTIKEQDVSEKVLHVVPYLGCFFYVLNVENELLKDINLRHAIDLCINREELLSVLGESKHLAAYSLIPEGTASFEVKKNNDRSFEKDLVEAKNLIKKSSSYEKLQDTKFNLLYNSTMKNKLVAEFIQDSLRKHLGLNVELTGQEWKTFVHNRKNHNFDIARFGWIGDFNDPTTFLNLFRTNSAQNHGCWKNNEYDLLLDKSDKSGISQEERMNLLRKAEEVLLADYAIIPLYFESSHHFVSTKITGWYDNILDLHPLQYIDIIEQ